MTRTPFALALETGREADLLRASLQYLRACRIEAWRSNVVAISAVDAAGRKRYVHSLPKGFADISGVLPGGRHLFVECKGLKGTLSPWQRAWQDKMRGLGCVVLTVKSIEDLRQGLRAAGLTVP